MANCKEQYVRVHAEQYADVDASWHGEIPHMMKASGYDGDVPGSHSKFGIRVWRNLIMKGFLDLTIDGAL